MCATMSSHLYSRATCRTANTLPSSHMLYALEAHRQQAFQQPPNAVFHSPKPWGKMLQHSRFLRIVLAAALLVILLSRYSQLHRWLSEHVSIRSIQTKDNPILNTTLGFQKLFVLSLPDRSDRRGPLLAGANATNLTVTFLDAIRDRQIPQTDRPKGWGQHGWIAKEGELGCLASHVRAWRKIVHENISSAIIMESDSDWDMRIKQSMVGVGKGTEVIADWPFDADDSTNEQAVLQQPEQRHTTRSPYGDKWDIIWLGHCGSAANGDGRVYAFNDSAAPDKDHVWVYGPQPSKGHRRVGTRMVYHIRESVCTTAYAMSNQGARKFDKLFEEANSPIDLKMWDACGNNPRLVCIGVFPQIMSMTASRTNIKHTGGGLSFGKMIKEEKIVAGKSVQVSSRVNAHLGLAAKGPEGWKWEWKANATSNKVDDKETEDEDE